MTNETFLIPVVVDSRRRLTLAVIAAVTLVMLDAFIVNITCQFN